MLASFDSSTFSSHVPALADPLSESMIGWRDHGDEASARHIVEQLTPLLRSIATRLLPRPWLVDDAVQSSLTKVFRSLENFDPRIPLAAWATCIMKNVCSNLLRSWNRQSAISLADLDIESLCHVERKENLPSQENIVISREELRFLTRQIAELNETDRTLIRQAAWNDLSADQLGRAVGLSSGAVRVRICRIRSVLRCALQDRNRIKGITKTPPKAKRGGMLRSTKLKGASTRSDDVPLQRSTTCLAF